LKLPKKRKKKRLSEIEETSLLLDQQEENSYDSGIAFEQNIDFQDDLDDRATHPAEALGLEQPDVWLEKLKNIFADEPRNFIDTSEKFSLLRASSNDELSSQENFDYTSYPSDPRYCSCSHALLPQQFTIRHVQGWGEGIGFGTDYTTVSLMMSSDYFVGQVLPMIDMRVHRFDNNLYAANFGLAGRYIPQAEDCFCELLGFNAFYDYRQGMKGNYSQVGLGLEVLGCRWDFRANAYFPIGVKKHKTKCFFDDYTDGFFAIHRECEFTSYGFNAEIGYTKPWCDFLLYGAAGPYYLVRKCHNSTLGGKVRLRPQYRDYLALDLSYSYDPVFNSVFQAEIILNLPLYQIFSCKGPKPCCFNERQIYQPIERFEVMPLGRRSCWERNF
jgi:hypothetical protein